MLNCLFFLSSVLPSLLLSPAVGDLNITAVLPTLQKPLKSYTCLLYYKRKTQKWNKIDSKLLKGKIESPHWTGSRQKSVWVSVYEYLRLSCQMASLRDDVEKPTPYPLQSSWKSDWAVPVCSSLTNGTGNPSTPAFHTSLQLGSCPTPSRRKLSHHPTLMDFCRILFDARESL